MFLECEVAEETELGPTADDHDDTAVAAAAHDGDDDWRAWRSPIYARCLAVVGGPSGELSIDCCLFVV